MFNDFLYENLSIYEIMWENMLDADTPRMTIQYGAKKKIKFASRTTKQGYRHTLITFNIHCFSMATIVALTHLSVPLNIYYLPFL